MPRCPRKTMPAAEVNVSAEPVIIETSAPSDASYHALLAELRRYTAEMVGVPDNQSYAILIHDPQTAQTVGGLWAQSRWGGFHIDILVLPEELRGQGIGSRLMAAAEAEALRRGCRHMWLDTYSFQARPFYEQFGFEVFAQLDGPAPIYPRYFMKKVLS